MARDLIQQNLSRSQTVEKMAEFQFHNTRKPQPGGDRSGPASRPATTKPYQEQAQEEMRGSGALPSHMAVWHSEEERSGRHSVTGHRAEHTSMVFKKLREKLEEEKQQTEWRNTRLREAIRARERSYREGWTVPWTSWSRWRQNRLRGGPAPPQRSVKSPPMPARQGYSPTRGPW